VAPPLLLALVLVLVVRYLLNGKHVTQTDTINRPKSYSRSCPATRMESLHSTRYILSVYLARLGASPLRASYLVLSILFRILVSRKVETHWKRAMISADAWPCCELPKWPRPLPRPAPSGIHRGARM
jgi:hypothetical protein